MLWLLASPGQSASHTVKCCYNVVLIYHDITYDTVITVTESESDVRITTGTPYLALTGELWGVSCEDLGENRQHYNDTALYLHNFGMEEWYKMPILIDVNPQ